MGWQLRKWIRFGPARLTLGKRGMSGSAGLGPFRLSRGADGRWRRTIRPMPGVYRADVLRGRGARPEPSERGDHT